MIIDFSVYNTCTLLLNNEKYVDANLDAPDNAKTGNEHSSEMLTSRSLEIKPIWTFDPEFTIFNK